MTSEPDSTKRLRPPTIDLTATEIPTERTAQAAGPARPDERGSDRDATAGWDFAGSVRPLALGAGVGVVATAIIVAALWFAGVLPSQNPQAADAPVSGSADISAQLNKIQAELQARQSETALGSRLAAVEAQDKVLNDSLGAINRRLDEAVVAAQNALEHAKGATQGTVRKSDLDSLAGRIASLEATVKTLADAEAHRTTSANDRAARSTVAAEALRAVVERGAPYTAELAAVKSLGVDRNATAPLEPFAATGIPGAADLARQLAQLTPELLKASGGESSGGSFLGRLESNAKGLVRITPVDAPPGDDPAAIVARINTDAARSDIAAAAADIERLPPSAKTLAAPWLQKVQARDAAITASRHIAAAALAALDNNNSPNAGTQ